MCTELNINGVECNTLGEVAEILLLKVEELKTLSGAAPDEPHVCLCDFSMEHTCKAHGISQKLVEWEDDFFVRHYCVERSDATTSELSQFQCDRCGACCRSLILEAQFTDAEREPKLYQIANMTPQQFYMEEKEGACIVLNNVETHGCHFLQMDKQGKYECGIYATRPAMCIHMQPGDAQCQHARMSLSIPPLRDVFGRLPSSKLMEDTAEIYSEDGLDGFFTTSAMMDQIEEIESRSRTDGVA